VVDVLEVLTEVETGTLTEVVELLDTIVVVVPAVLVEVEEPGPAVVVEPPVAVVDVLEETEVVELPRTVVVEAGTVGIPSTVSATTDPAGTEAAATGS
jgi:hypothetical protein